jgi:hypothetical protein
MHEKSGENMDHTETKRYYFNKYLSLFVLVTMLFLCFETHAESNSGVYGISFTNWSLSFSSIRGGYLSDICLYREKSTSGWFSLGNKKTRIGFDLEQCEERLVADLDNRVLYFNFDSGTTKPNGREIYCGSMQLTNDPDKGRYSPCTSRFFSQPSDSSRSSYRVFSFNNFVQMIRDEYASIDILDKEYLKNEKIKISDKLKNESEKLIEEKRIYLAEYESIKNLDQIYAFENQYRNSDTDNLIRKLEPLKLQLETKQYQDRFDAAKSSSELQSFISEYESKDPDRLIPEAKRRLAAVLKVEQAELARLTRAKLAEEEKRKREQVIEQKQGKLLGLESSIANCTRMTAQADRAIAREREIAAVSGYVNTSVMRQAGEYIVYCRSVISDGYAEYRKAGGTKNLSEIK